MAVLCMQPHGLTTERRLPIEIPGTPYVERVVCQVIAFLTSRIFPAVSLVNASVSSTTSPRSIPQSALAGNKALGC